MRDTAARDLPTSHGYAAGANLPLSFAQERFWFLQSLNPESPAFNITAHRGVFAPVDPDTLRRAVGAVLRRHEVLRANFQDCEGAPVQIIRPNSRAEVEFHDLRHNGAADAQRLISELSGRTFDLARDPLFRVALLRVANDEHIVVLAIHHIVCDGWSIGILLDELNSFYSSYWGAPAEIRELALQYSDYVRWERERQNSEAVLSQVEYWKQKLAGPRHYAELPLDHARDGAGFNAGLHRFELDAATSESLKRAAREEGATVFMVLLAVLKALLFRYTDQSEVVVGTPVSTRTQPDFEPLAGCFINTQVLRTNVSGRRADGAGTAFPGAGHR